ncbi:MAG: hypothetical protein IPM58_07600 [Nitrospira sp.]|nr:hypothetical protein [Nitrospira sp.]
MPNPTLCVYTTMYPSAKPYLNDWYQSILRQTDQDFQLWVGLDAMSVEEATAAIGDDAKATWVLSEPGDSPAQVRQRALERIVERYDGVVLVDSDDILHESRVAVARTDLQQGDLAGCALNLIDRTGTPLDMIMTLPSTVLLDELFPRNNIFGLSNSAFRTDLLRRCLPIPSATVLVDWFLSTRAWLYGGRLLFDRIARMDYRQHDQNMAQVRPPFTEIQITRDTNRVIEHFQIVTRMLGPETITERVQRLDQVRHDIQTFYDRVVVRTSVMKSYLESLNQLPPTPIWWASVAHPSLRTMWAEGI